MFGHDKAELRLLRLIMGGSLISRLYTILREKNGLTYTSRVSTAYYEHMGHIMFYAITDSAKILHNGTGSRKQTRKRGGKRTKKGVYPLMLDLLADLVKHGVSEKEVAGVKKYMKGHEEMNLEDADTQVSHNGLSWLLYNSESVVPYKDIYDTWYADVSREQINNVIAKYFKPENMNVAMVGGDLPDVRLVKRMAMEMW
jgi:predicted Zn-dependent peptidase